MKYRLAKIEFTRIGRFLSYTCAIMLLIAMIFGDIPFHANQIAVLLNNLFKYRASIIISPLILSVTPERIKHIAFVATGLVPIMIVLYVGMCVYLICVNRNNLLDVLSTILQDIFNRSAIRGGVLNGLVPK